MDDGELAWSRVIPKEQSYRGMTITAKRDNNHRIAPREYWPDGTPVNNPLTDRERSAGYVYDVTDEWDRKDPGQEWDYGSFALVSPLNQSWIALVFNDHLKNLDGRRKKRAVFSSGNRSYLSVIKIDRYGYMDAFHPYVRDKKRKPIPLPSFYHDTRTGRIVFPAARRNNTFQLMELNFKQP